MSRVFTVAQIKERIRQRADMQKSRFVSDSELLNYINESLATFWDILTNKFEGFGLESVEFNVTSGYDTYQVPPALLRIEKVEVEYDGRWRTIKSVPFARINEVGSNWHGEGLPFVYARKGLYQIVFKPSPTAAYTARINYVARAPILETDSQNIDGINGWEQYIVVDCAIKCLDKEERDTTVLQNEKAEIIRRLNESVGNRDESTSFGIRDINERDYYNGSEDFWS